VKSGVRQQLNRQQLQDLKHCLQQQRVQAIKLEMRAERGAE
jgi:hypothetical protein